MNNPNYTEKINKAYYARYRTWPAHFNIIPNSTVLDIGCGQGHLGRFLKERYLCNVTGLEVIESNARVAESNLDRVMLGDIETFPLKKLEGSYNYVIFSDSLEHLLNPDKVLLRLAPLFSSGESKLLISIPNVRNFRVTLPLLFLGNWCYTDEGLLDKTHLRVFTLKSICKLLDDCNFSVERVKYDLPILSKSGCINFFTLGLFRDHLTSHFFIQACRKKY